MICLGIDPDTKNTGIAVVVARRETLMRSTYEVIFAGTADAKGKLVQDRLALMAASLGSVCFEIQGKHLIEVAVVEWQRLRPNREKNPNSILDLTGIAGMAVAACEWHFSGPILTPIPSDWKGQVSKEEHQKRILKRVNLGRWCGYKDLNKTQQGHVIDAIGLAIWGHEQMLLKGAG